MGQTKEQKEAYEALTAAVDALHRAHNDGEAQGISIKYLLISQRQWWDEDGDSWTVVDISVKDGEVALNDQLGLVEFAAARIRHAIVTAEEDDDEDD